MNKRNLVFLLLASVAINLLLIGGIAWRSANVRQFVPLIPPSTGWIIRDLDEARRAELAPMTRESFESVRTARAEMFLAQRRVNELISAQSYGRDAVEDAFAELRELSMDYQALSHERTVRILQQLTPEERQAAVEFVRRGGPRAGRDGPRGRDLRSRERREQDPPPGL